MTFSKAELKTMTDRVGSIATMVTKAGIAGGVSIGGAGGGSSLGGGGSYNPFTCDINSDCYKNKHDAYLKQVYIEKGKDLERAPLDLSRAEKNYYTFNKGQNGGAGIYEKHIIDRFAKTADQFKTNSIERQQEYMAELSQSLKQYQAGIVFKKQSLKLLKVREADQARLMKNINYYQSIVQTKERQVVYENQNMDTLYSYRRIMFFVYYAGLISFIIFGNFIPDKLYTNYSVWLIIVLIAVFPLLLNILLKWAFIILDAFWDGNPPLPPPLKWGAPPKVETPSQIAIFGDSVDEADAVGG
jgi:hypothetical protein